VLMCWRRL